MVFTPEQIVELTAVTRPLQQWLNDNCHPHVVAIVDSENMQLMEGITTVQRVQRYDEQGQPLRL